MCDRLSCRPVCRVVSGVGRRVDPHPAGSIFELKAPGCHQAKHALLVNWILLSLSCESLVTLDAKHMKNLPKSLASYGAPLTPTTSVQIWDALQP